MARCSKIWVTIDSTLLTRLDAQVKERKLFLTRSHFIEQAIRGKLQRMRKTRLAQELAKIDPRAEQQLANERFIADTGF
jgi:metal-responsive CopG/Arc/MetJ family transcriptional regulator